MVTKHKPTPSQQAVSEVIEKEAISEVVSASEISTSEHTETKVSKSLPKLAHKRKRGKQYLNAKNSMPKTPQGIREAIMKLKDNSFAHFVETMELHINTLTDSVRGEVDLPYSNGKQIVVASATDKIIEELEKGIITFDLLVATPAMMPKLTKYAKMLGPRGLMPNPKAGTVGPDIDVMVKKFSGNTVRYKTEPKSPIIHLVVGKVQDPDDHLVANIEAYTNAVGKRNIRSAYLATSMSPSLQIIVQ